MYNASCYIAASVKECQTERYTLAQESETKSAQFMIRMRPSVKKAGEKAAADDNRSLSSLMETLLIDYLEANGYLPKARRGGR